MSGSEQRTLKQRRLQVGGLGDTTLQSRLQRLTTREVRGVEEVRDLRRRLAFPSELNLTDIIRRGAVLGFQHLTMYDYSLERLVYGPNPETLAGKTVTARAPVEAKVWRSPFLSREVTLTGDIFFFRGGKYFVSVSFPLDYVMISEILTRQRLELGDVLKEHVLAYKAKRFDVVLFLHDREASVVGLQDLLAAEGVSLEFASSGNHLGKVERVIRTIKNHVRCLMLDQNKKFKQARRFDKYCVHWGRRMRNWFPNRKTVDLVSPATHFFGRELDLNLDLRAGWMDHVLAKADTDKNLLNTARPRMVSCFVVGASPSVVGGYILFNVETKSIIVRTQF